MNPRKKVLQFCGNVTCDDRRSFFGGARKKSNARLGGQSSEKKIFFLVFPTGDPNAIFIISAEHNHLIKNILLFTCVPVSFLSSFGNDLNQSEDG